MKYDINEVCKLKDEQHLKWKLIEEIIGVSSETLRKAYRRFKDNKTCTEQNPNNYNLLKLRGLRRKYEIILERGGKCECCGYDKNIAALEFHHINPQEKEFLVDMSRFANTSLEKLLLELAKCKLLCANCHRELHNPNLTKENVPNIIDTLKKIKSFSNQKDYGSICPVCGKKFPKHTGKIYCSKECREMDKHYPTYKEVTELYRVLGTWSKVAEYFGLTRKIILGIRNRNS